MATEDVPTTDLITLTRYLPFTFNQRASVGLTGAIFSHVLHDQMRLGVAATGDLTLLLTAIQVTSKFIATNVRRARLINL